MAICIYLFVFKPQCFQVPNVSSSSPKCPNLTLARHAGPCEANWCQGHPWDRNLPSAGIKPWRFFTPQKMKVQPTKVASSNMEPPNQWRFGRWIFFFHFRLNFLGEPSFLDFQGCLQLTKHQRHETHPPLRRHACDTSWPIAPGRPSKKAKRTPWCRKVCDASNEEMLINDV